MVSRVLGFPLLWSQGSGSGAALVNLISSKLAFIAVAVLMQICSRTKYHKYIARQVIKLIGIIRVIKVVMLVTFVGHIMVT
jgi:hypothetical protein